MTASLSTETAPGARQAPDRARTIEERVDEAFRAFVEHARFPCLAGKGVVRRRDHQLGVYGALASVHASDALAADLAEFTRGAHRDSDRFTAFVAVFTGRAPASERAFEQRLWAQLQRLHERDDPATGWDPAVSADPDDPRFSFSFGGRALFVVGLHPRSSRLARRFRWPALVFNAHSQFEQLRREGHYERLRAQIRERDIALQGSPNPNLADFGERSEARQYSGRDSTAAEWRCPFHRGVP
ncbi:MAG TPA: guanitoxin biosynthesis heme-dependent pre-guanitoxin N-hydroxylase GntA [Gemmatimonadaceae bacterium]|nr:guanitoxin biosynthesis heme-dependent pre-guanitoxin N-hydroxylase GntA [Gemmatimonadaceae bacterium]